VPPTVADLRLVPGAAIGWLGAWFVVAAEPGITRPAGLVMVALAVAVLAGGRARVGARAGFVDPRLPAAGSWRGSVVFALLALAAVLLAGSAHVALRQAGIVSRLVREQATVGVIGRVSTEPRQIAATNLSTTDDAAHPRYLVRIEVDRLSGRGVVGPGATPVVAIGGPSWAGIGYGARVAVVGRLEPGQAGEPPWLDAADAPVTVIQPPGALDSGVRRIRTALRALVIDQSRDVRGLLPGIVLGDTGQLDPQLGEDMRTVSLTHTTAVSGTHFAIIAATVIGLLSALGLPRPVRAGVTTVAMAGFVLLVHPDPSVLRAAAMGLIGMSALLLGRPSRALAALGTAVVVLLVLDPWLARSYGFALSVLATAGLVLGAQPLARGLAAVLPQWLARAVAIPIAAQLACAPVIVLLNPAVATFAVPANLLSAAALVPATVCGVAAALLAPWWSAGAWWLVQPAAWACWWIAQVAHVCAGLPGASIPWAGGPGGAVALALVTATIVTIAATMRRIPRLIWRQLGIGTLCLALVLSPPARRLLLAWSPDGWPPPGWRIAVCDVGQGDATVVRTGPGSAIVIDVGPPGTAADRCLTALGVTRIPLLVLSHYHLDHVGGLAAVLAGRRVGEVLATPFAHPAEQERMVAATLAAHHLTLREVDATRAPTSGTVGDVAWRVLWPAAPASGAGSDVDGTPINNASLVLLITAPELSLLALGDIETESQDALAEQLESEHVRRPAELVKVAHHGSARQSRALAALLDPDVAVISVGAGNEYGHPASSTVDLYRNGGAVVLRTDHCGSMAFRVRDGVAELTARCPRLDRDAAASRSPDGSEGQPCVAGCAHARLATTRALRIPPRAHLGRRRARAGGPGHRRGVLARRPRDGRRARARPRAGRRSRGHRAGGGRVPVGSASGGDLAVALRRGSRRRGSRPRGDD